MKKSLLASFVLFFIVLFANELNAAVTYKLTYNSGTGTYTVSFKSSVAYSGPLARITGSTQFTIVAPDPDNTGPGVYTVTNLTNLTALQMGLSQLNSPAENPTKDYLFFAPTNSGSYAPFNIPANTYIDLFTFQTSSGCLASLYLFDNDNDPLNTNGNVNADNNFKVLGGGNVNLYTGNESSNDGCACTTYKLTLDPDGQTYRVSFNSGVAYNGPLARITGSTQFTVVISDPDGAGGASAMVTNLTPVTALQIGVSQLNSPAENPTKDYAFFAPTNSGSYTLFNIPANTDVDLFTFKITGNCSGDVYLFDNVADPLNANGNINADNNFKTLGGGNTNLYCYNTSGIVPLPNPTITLSAIAPVCPNAASASLPYTATTGGADQYSIDFDAAAEAAGFVDVVNATLPASPISITIPANATCGTFNATLTVRNSSLNCVSTPYNIVVTLQDNGNPVISTCPPTENYEGCNTGAITSLAYSATEVIVTGAQFAGVGGVATDGCGIVQYKYSDTQTGACPIVVTRHWTVTDACGNSVSCNQTINVDDNTNPTASNPAPVTVQCPADVPAPNISVVTDEADNCTAAPTVAFVSDVSDGNTCPEVITRTYSVTDACGNAINVTQTITIDDTTNPTASNPAPVTVQCPADVPAPNVSVVTDEADNCTAAPAVAFVSDVSDGNSCPEIITRTYSVTDACGNAINVTQTITIDDTTNPTASNPAPLTVQCPADVPAPNVSVVTDEADNCTAAPTVAFVSDVSDGNSCPEIITRTYSVTDACGNAINVTQTITIDDTTNPTASNPAPVTVQCPADVPAPNVSVVTDEADNCTAAPTVAFVNDVSDGNTCPEVITRTYSVTDACGNAINVTQTITIDDTTNPTASNPASVTVQCPADVPAPNIAVVTDEADNCTAAPTVAFVSDVSDGNTCPEIITRTYSVTDACGNQILVTQTITIDDTTNPTASNPASVTVQCPADVPAPNVSVVTDEADNCTAAPTVAFVSDVSDGNTCPEIITRTYSVTDACGNAINVTQTITIDDTTNPTASNPAPVTVQCPADVPAPNVSVVTDEADNCTAAPTVAFVNDVSDGNTCPEVITRTYSVTDACGNAINVTQTITIDDTTNPTASNPAPVTVQCPADVPAPNIAVVTDEADNCTAAPTVAFVSDVSDGNTCPEIITRTYSVTDACGNQILVTQTITIDDTANPTASNPASVTVQCPADVPAPNVSVVTDEADNCTAAPTVAFVSDVSDGNTCPEVITRTYSVTDACGNAINVTQTITIDDTTNPTASNPAPVTVQCLADVPAPNVSVVTDEADNCTAAPTVAFVSDVSDGNTCPEIITRTYSVTDACGNAINVTQTITIDDTTNPTASNPASVTVQCPADVPAPNVSVVTDEADNCTAAPTVAFVSDVSDGNTCPEIITRTYSVTDACGNQILVTQTITIDDTTNPTASNPASVTVQCPADVPAPNVSVVTDEADNCTAAPTVAFVSDLSDGNTCPEIITRTYSVTDACGNQILVTQTITIDDTTNPTASNPVPVTVQCPADVPAPNISVVTDEADNCTAAPAVAFVSDVSDGNTCPEVITRTYSVTDVCGNAINVTQTITIDDTTNPTASNPAPVTVQCPADVPAPNVSVVTDEADNCTAAPTVAFVSDVSDGNTCPEVITRTYSVTDACGNQILVTQTITIDDTTNPTASNPASVTVQCPADVPAPNVSVVTDEADNCTAAPTVAFVSDLSDGNTCPEIITRTYSVTDACGNQILVTQTITIDDTTNPTASNPVPVTVQCPADVPAPNIAVVTDEADNCTAAPAVAFVSDVSDGNTCPEVITRTYSVTDACGNAINVTQTITIDDTTNPTASNPAPVTVQCPADVPAPNVSVVTDEADNCTAAPTVAFVSDVSDGNTCPEVITRTYSVTDACGNAINVTQTITIDDTTNPTASNPAPVTVQCLADVPAPNVSVVTDEADNCTAAPTVAFVSDLSDGNTCPEVITRTYSVTDACGNQILVTQTITIDDTTNPTASNPAPVTVQCPADVPAPNISVVTDEADNCTAAPTVAFVSDVSDGNTCPEVITRTYSVTDACGNAINVTQTITIDDTTNPTASNPAPVTVQCPADVPAPNVSVVTDEADNCTAAPTVAFVSDVSDGNTCPEVITRTYSVTDACGNAINVTQTITIDDTTNPTASNPAPVTVQCPADVPAPNVSVVTDEADNCTAAPTVAFVSDVSDGNTCPEIITRTYSVTDACGNAINVTQTITIDDTTNPTASNPAPVTVQCPADVPAPNISVVTDEADNCTAAPTVAFVSDVSDGNTCPEVITRTYSVTDACGNAINVTQTITIDDTTNPTASNPAPVTVQCPADVPAPNVSVVTDEADNCTAAPTVAFVSDVSDGNTCPEVITRTYSVTDACGNQILVTQTITIDDTTNPTASNPAPVTVQCLADVPAPNVSVVTDEADNCTAAPTVAFVSDLSDGNTCPEVITRTYSVTDACGNQILVTQTITIDDTTNPTASNPASVTVQCPADVPAPNIAVVTDEADNCTAAPTVAFVSDLSDGNTCPEVITRTYSVTDVCGNAINVTQTITIDDTTNPTASNPAPVTVQCPADVPAPNVSVVTDEADNCTAAPTVAFVSDVSDGNTCPEIITRTYSVTDACGNQILVTQTITIDDTTNPTASNPASVTVQCPADVPAPNITVVTDEADNCTAAPTVAFVSDVSDGNTCPEVITRTYSVTDACGNAINVTQTITIDDTTNPTASNPAPVTVQCLADVPAPNVSVVTDEADNCTAAPTVAFVSDVSDGNTCPEVITRTYSVTDVCGNAINVTQTITIDDTTNPTASNPAPVTVQCPADVPAPNIAVVTDEADNCTAAPTVAFVSDASDGNTCPEVIMRTYSVTDACGNAINVTQTITIDDTTNPTASNPAPVTVQCPADVPAPNISVVTDEADNCTAAPTVAFVSDLSDGNSCPEVIMRTYSVTDACGNAINVTQTITIDDTTNPTASNPAPVTAQCPADVPAPNISVVTDEADNCTAAPTVAFVSDVSDGNTCPEVITRTYSVTDACGNAINVTQTITIDDTTNPTASNPAPVTAQCPADVPAPNISVVTDEADNCTAAPTVAFVSDVSDGNTCPEVITRTYSVTDACGNAINVTQTITIDDTTNPTFTAPADITIYADANCNYDASVGNTNDVTDEADNCSAGLVATFSDVTAPGSCPGSQVITRTWSLVDACGNAAPDQVQIITVKDNTPPVLVQGTIASYYPTVAAAEAAALAATSATDNCSATLMTSVATVGNCPATVTVTVTDECSNSSNVSYTTSIHDIVLNPQAAFQPICTGGSVVVQGNASGGSAPLTHQWTIDPSSSAGGTFLSATNLPNVVVEGNIPGTLVLNYSVTDNNGCNTSALVNVTVAGDCAVFGIIDPCSCNNDASVDGDNGSFSELVAVTGPGGAPLPAGQVWTIQAIAGAYTDDGAAGPGVTGAPVAVGTTLAFDVVNGDYFITFDHVDAQGYTVTVEGPNAPGTPGNFFMTVSNTCFYPHPVVVGPLTVCTGSTPFNLEIQGVDASANTQATPFDTDSDDSTPESVSWLNGTTGQIDPGANDFPGGQVTVYYHYDAPDAPSTSSPGCGLTVSFTVNSNNMPPLSAGTSVGNNVSCFGGSNGSATVTASGGSSPYTYLWNNGQTTATINNLTAGVYTVTITDDNGCTAVASVTITEPAQLTASISAQTNVLCNGASTGSATVTASGGTTAYGYLWSNGQTDATATGLAAGPHSVTVTDAKGCTATATVTITEPTLLLAEIISSQNTSCNGAADGSATVNATGGTTAYNYLWSNGQTTATATGLAAGPHSVTVTDDNGCTATASVTISEPAALSASANQVNAVSCQGGSDGSASASALGGTPGYTYLWSNGSADQTTTGLAAGPHTVTVTDAHGCTAVATVTISEPATGVSATITASTNVSCFGGSNGSATVTASGGSSPYAYLWNNGQTTATINNLTAGVYTVTITDDNGCTAVASVTITEPAQLTASISAQTNVLCNGASTGTATVTAAGGTTAYGYLWSNGQTDATATGLSAGVHSVTVTDAKGCTATATVTITEPTALLAEIISSQNTSCNGAADGSATVNATGGTTAYNYLWSNGQTTATATGLAAGPHSVTVTDDNGCTATASVTIQDGTALSMANIPDITVCPGGAIGDILLIAQPANPAIVFNWTGGNTAGLANGSATGLNPAIPAFSASGTEGITTVTVNAALQTCTATETFTITIDDATPPVWVNCPSDMTVNNDADECGALVNWVLPTANDNCSGSVTVSQTAGSAPGAFFAVATPVTQTYTADDGNGNVATCSFTVTALDTQLPDLQCPGGIQTIGTDNGVCQAIINGTALDATANDNCPNVTLTNNINGTGSLGGGTSFNLGPTTVVWTATDASANTNTCSFTLNVYDDEAPTVVSCPGDLTVGTDQDVCQATVNYAAPVFADNCGGTSTLMEGLASGSVFPVGTTTVTFSYQDNTPDNNPAICSFTVTVEDDQAPEITCNISSAMLDNSAGQCAFVNSGTNFDPVFSDNCPQVSVSHDYTPAPNSSSLTSAEFPLGTTIVVWTAADAAGNTATCSVEIIVEDTEDPVFVNCLATDIFTSVDADQCNANVSFATPVATDNCSVLVSQTAGLASGSAFPVGTTTVEFTAVDPAGNTAVCSFNVVVQETQLPTAVCQDLTVYLDASGNATIDADDVDGGSSDNCAIETLTIDVQNFDCANTGDNNVTLTVMDEAGNFASCVATVTVLDNLAPTFTCPSAQTVSGCDQLVPNLVALVTDAADNCGIASITQNPVAGTDFGNANGGSIDVTILVTDENGNTTSCVVPVTIDDNVPPVFANCPTDLTVGNDVDECGSNVTFATPVATDNCGGVTVTQTEGPASGALFPPGTTTVSFEASDDVENVSTCSFTITVNDVQAPTAVCQNITVNLDASGNATIDVDDVNAGSSDNCSLETVSIDIQEFDCTNVGDNNVTLTVTDAASNTASCVATVTVLDNLAPTFTCPSAQTVSGCDQLVPNLVALVTDAADNCGIASITQNPVAGTDFGNANGGSIDVTILVTDENGNTTSCVVPVTIDDNVPPAFTNCPANLTVGNDVDKCGSNVTFATPSATDNCPGVTVVQTAGPASGALFPVGTTTVSFKATDAVGNMVTCSFTITVNDVQAPTAVCQNLTVNLNAAGTATITAAQVNGASTDNCTAANALTLSINTTSFTCANVGDNNVTLTVTDAASNAASCVATVTVLDNLAPTFTCPSAQTVSGCDQLVPNLVTLVTDAADNCGIASITQNPVAGTDFGNANGGVVNVTITVTDTHGNTATCVVPVTINDNVPPAFVNCPANLTVGNDVDKCGSNVTFATPSATDNCPGVTVVQTAGPVSGALFPVGTTTVSFKATDAVGNMVTCSFTITVNDVQAPTAVCQNLTVNLNAAGTATITAAQVNGASTDNCTAANALTLSINTTSFTCANVGDNNVTLTVTDAASNTASCVATVTVLDNLAPTFTCPSTQTVSGCDQLVPNLVALVTNAADNCGIASITQNPVAGTDFGNANGGVVNVTITVTDTHGNTTTCVVPVTISDNVPPAFVNCPTSMIMIGNDVDQCSGKINWTQPVAIDNCPGVTVVQTAGPASGTVVPVGTPVTITYKATDAAGNTANCIFQVQIIDTQLPEFDADIVMPADVTVACNQVPPAFVLKNTDVHDNCTLPQNLVITFTETSSPNAPNPCGNTNFSLTRTWKVTDAAGNMLVYTQHITVADNQAPIAVCQDVSVTLNAFGVATITAAQVNNGSSDNCIPAQSLNLAVNPSSFNCSNLGANTVTLTVTDACGNFSTCSAVVTVLQGPAPCAPQYDIDGSDPCVCLNNATTLTNGQFSELIQLKSLAGQTWTIQSASGLYSPNSPNPPAAPISLGAGTPFLAGTADGINNDGDGQTDEADENIYYTLRARHVDGIGYTAVFANNLGQNLTIGNKCYYPTPAFTNLNDPFCLSTPPFTIGVADVNGAQGTVTEIRVDGVLTNTFDAASLGEGVHTVSAIFDAGMAQAWTIVNGQTVAGSDAAAQADPGCQQPISTYVQITGTPSNLVCNDELHLSLDADCIETVLPDEVLEGTYYCYDDYTVVIDYPPGTTHFNPANQVDATHIGKTMTYHLVHYLTGNVCWGVIIVEDKLAPALGCPDDITVACSEDTEPIHTGTITIQDCSPTTTVIDDEFTDFGQCSNPRGQIVRTWIVTDSHGNQSTCSQTITITPFSFADLDFPADVTLDCEDVHLDPQATAPTATGQPSINGYAIGVGGLCMASINHSDEVYDICPGSYEILRTWKVRNMCLPVSADNPVVHVQVIKVNDFGGPQFTCPPAVTVSTDPFNCCATAALPDMIVSEGCSNISNLEAKVTGTNPANGNIITFTVPGYLTDFPGNNWWIPDTLAVFDYTQCLPLGDYTVRYTATDACSNISTCQFVLTVADLVPPAVTCQEVTQVSIGAGGQVEVLASSFDSDTYDNCCLDSLLVRRMDHICGDTLQDDFGSSVFFCCSDITDTVRVILRATDCSGNFNECMIQVYVDDKLKPTCNAPANVSVSCENFDPSLWVYGFATGVDNCCLDTITAQNSYSLFDTVCNRGTITRTFRVYDCAGQSSQCTQRVFVSYEQDYFVKFPNDVIVTVCDGTGNYGEPTFFGEDCELLGVSSEDQVFTVVPDACFKIERTWQIINWCTYNANLPCVYIPNPNPNPITNSTQNLPGPVISAPGTAAPWAPTKAKVNPTDAQQLDYSVFYTGGTYTDYGNNQQITVPPINGVNCLVYKQIIKVIDTQDPVVENCPDTLVTACDYTVNTPQLWNEMYWWDGVTEEHDLCEGPTDLSITTSDACTGNGVNVRFILLLDLDGDGTMETAVSSTNLPAPGTVNYGNAANPNFSGGTPRSYDERPVPANQLYNFAIQTTLNGTKKVATLKWNTPAAPNTYVTPELPYGTHKIKWIVEDGCGNETECEYNFEVKDCKPPTVVCLNGLSVNIMATGMITLWATDFLQYAEDNCTPPTPYTAGNKLVYGIRKSGTGTGFPLDAQGHPITSVTFDCTEIGTQPVELWAMDLAGNAAYCETYVIVQDNDGICSPNGNATVAGFLQTEPQAGAEGVEEADLDLQGSHPALPPVSMFDLSDNNGYYAFGNALPIGSDYTVTPVKDDNPMNGVSTFDLVLISKHVLGVEPLTSPYKIIAADANKSNSVTTFDILELRKLILGIYTELPNNTSWRFMDENFQFDDPGNPFANIPFAENVSVGDIQSNHVDDNFVGIKVGDVNGSVIANANQQAEDRTAGTLFLDAEDREVKAGETFEVTFRTAEQVQGFQFTLNLNGLQVVDIEKGEKVSADNFGVFTDALTASIDGAAAFTVKFRASKAGKLSQMLQLSSRITRSEAYNSGGQSLDIALRFSGKTIAGVGFELYQNVPNPFVAHTAIGFHLPEAATATLTVYDETGRTVYTTTGAFAKGYNMIQLNRALTNTTGMLYYRLETAHDSATKTMIQTR